jgi:hypothetical protein
LTGVFLGDSPMDINEGATGDQVLQVEFPDDVNLEDVELVEEHKPYREWCVPAALTNACATVTLMSQDEVDADRSARIGAIAKRIKTTAYQLRTEGPQSRRRRRSEG